MMDDLPNGPENYDEPPAFFPRDPGGSATGGGTPVKVKVEGVYSSEESGTISRFVQLEDDNDRILRISIGPFEALSIHIALENSAPSRPLTHDLMRVLIEKLEGRLDRIVIDDLWNQTYYAKLYVEGPQGEIEIDCRPSDAIALALRMGTPVYVVESIFEGFEREEDLESGEE